MESNYEDVAKWLDGQLRARELEPARGAYRPLRVLNYDSYEKIQGNDETLVKDHFLTGVIGAQRLLLGETSLQIVTYNHVMSGILTGGTAIRLDPAISEAAKGIINDSCPFCGNSK